MCFSFMINLVLYSSFLFSLCYQYLLLNSHFSLNIIYAETGLVVGISMREYFVKLEIAECSSQSKFEFITKLSCPDYSFILWWFLHLY